MAIHTPPHGERCDLADPLHGLHLTVAGLATNLSLYMDPVAKVDMVGKNIDANPGDRLSFLHKIHNFLYLSFAGGRLSLSGDHWTMAAVAALQRRDPSDGGSAGVCMTELTVQAIRPGMDLVAEGNRLNRGVFHRTFSAAQGGKSHDAAYDYAPCTR